MSVWPFLWALVAAALVLTAGRGDWSAALALAFVGAAMVATRALHGLPPGAYEMAAVLVWLVAATGVTFATAGRGFFAVAVLLVELPCYLWAWAGEVPRAFGAPPWVLADLAVIAAVLSLAGAGRVRGHLRHRLRRRGSGRAAGLAVLAGGAGRWRPAALGRDRRVAAVAGAPPVEGGAS